MEQVRYVSGAGDVTAGYPFHDPDFVAWWVRSLYVLPPELQVEAAEAVREAVHVAAVHKVLADFVAEVLPLVEARLVPSGELVSPTSVTPIPSAHDMATESELSVRSALAGAWRANRLATAVGVTGLVLLVGKGLWSLVQLVF